MRKAIFYHHTINFVNNFVSTTFYAAGNIFLENFQHQQLCNYAVQQSNKGKSTERFPPFTGLFMSLILTQLPMKTDPSNLFFSKNPIGK